AHAVLLAPVGELLLEVEVERGLRRLPVLRQEEGRSQEDGQADEGSGILHFRVPMGGGGLEGPGGGGCEPWRSLRVSLFEGRALDGVPRDRRSLFRTR